MTEKNVAKSIFVENIVGAITATGLLPMSKARPDGHTIGALTYDSIITLSRGEVVPGYLLDNMRYIARITKGPTRLWSRRAPASPASKN